MYRATESEGGLSREETQPCGGLGTRQQERDGSYFSDQQAFLGR